MALILHKGKKYSLTIVKSNDNRLVSVRSDAVQLSASTEVITSTRYQVKFIYSDGEIVIMYLSAARYLGELVLLVKNKRVTLDETALPFVRDVLTVYALSLHNSTVETITFHASAFESHKQIEIFPLTIINELGLDGNVIATIKPLIDNTKESPHDIPCELNE